MSLLEVTEQLGGSVVGEVKPDAIPFQLSFVTLWSRSDPDQGEKAAVRLRPPRSGWRRRGAIDSTRSRSHPLPDDYGLRYFSLLCRTEVQANTSSALSWRRTPPGSK